MGVDKSDDENAQKILALTIDGDVVSISATMYSASIAPFGSAISDALAVVEHDIKTRKRIIPIAYLTTQLYTESGHLC